MMNKQRIIDFLVKNQIHYPEYFKKNRLEKIKYGYTSDINQIYCYLNEIDIKKTEYFTFFNILNTYFNLNNKNICEIACGYIPILSKIIKENTDSKITAINNKIIINNYNGVNTIEADLTQNFNLNPFDLIIGFRSCNITETILLNCFKLKKEFMLYLCPCSNKPLQNINYKKEIWTYHNWHDYLINIIKNNKLYNTTIIYNHNLGDDCPIIIAKLK